MINIDLTPTAHAAHWSSAYVGRAWAPDFTCWDLVRSVQASAFGRTMPAFDPGATQAADELRAVVAASGWQRVVDTAHEGDVLLMRGPDGLHIGVVVHLGSQASLLHNLGGLLDGRAQGSVRIDAVDQLGALQYGRFELWRAL